MHFLTIFHSNMYYNLLAASHGAITCTDFSTNLALNLPPVSLKSKTNTHDIHFQNCIWEMRCVVQLLVLVFPLPPYQI